MPIVRSLPRNCAGRFALLLLAASLQANEPETVKEEVRRLLPDNFWAPEPANRVRLGGSAIGGGAVPSLFYTAAVECLDKGAGEAEYMEMSRHPNLCVRVVGMAGLARAGSAAGIDRLRELLASREGETGMPVGCRPAKLRESAIAWHFLTDTGYLCCRRKTPLLSRKDARSLALEVLYRDEHAGGREPGFHPEEVSAPARLMAREITGGGLLLRMDALSAAAPGLKQHQLVKAAGRLPAQLVTHFLIGVVHDIAATNDSRLGAASALARQQVLTRGEFETSTLRSAQVALDRLTGAMWGSDFARLNAWEWEKHRAKWPMTDLRKERYCWPESIVAWSAWGLNPSNPAAKTPPAQSWNSVAECVRDYAENYASWSSDWNAFGDTLYRLELLARHVGDHGVREIEPEPARLAVLKAVKDALRINNARRQ